MDMFVLIIAFAFGLFAGLVIYRAIYNEKMRQVNIRLQAIKIIEPKIDLFKKTLSQMMPDEVNKIFGQKFKKEGGDKNV